MASHLGFSIVQQSRITEAEPLSGLVDLAKFKILWKPPNVTYGDIDRAIVGGRALGLEGAFEQKDVTQSLRRSGWSNERTTAGYNILSDRSSMIAVTDGTVLLAYGGSTSKSVELLEDLVENQETSNQVIQQSDRFETMMTPLSREIYASVAFNPPALQGYHRDAHGDSERWGAAFEPVVAVGQTLTRAGGKVDCLTTFLVQNDPEPHTDAIRSNIVDQNGWGPIAYNDPSVSTIRSRIEVTERRTATDVFWYN